LRFNSNELSVRFSDITLESIVISKLGFKKH
jgi:hypothetical protein